MSSRFFHPFFLKIEEITAFWFLWLLLEPLFQLLSEKTAEFWGSLLDDVCFIFPCYFLQYQCYIIDIIKYVKTKNVEIHEREVGTHMLLTLVN